MFSPCMTYRRVCNKSKRLLEQKLPTFPLQISSSSVLSGVRVVKSLVFYVLQIIVCAFVFFRLMASDYPLGILKLFSSYKITINRCECSYSGCCFITSWFIQVLNINYSLSSFIVIIRSLLDNYFQFIVMDITN